MPISSDNKYNFQLTVRKRFWVAFGAALLVLAVLLIGCKLLAERYANNNIVSYWNFALEQAQVNAQSPIDGRSAAILHVAIFDAVNCIVQRYQPYRINEKAPPGANPESAADEAAYTVLISLYPRQKLTFDARLSNALGRISATNDSVRSGRDWGKRVAGEILKWRDTDGADGKVTPYLGSNIAGKWRPVDGQVSGDHPEHADITTFGVKDSNQFLPDPPPNLISSTYIANLAQIRKFGGINSKYRTQEQTSNAEFLSDNIYLRWNRVARRFVNDHVDLEDSARIFAVLDIASADAGITTWKAKYTYGFWRPETAITNDKNDADPHWMSLVLTPNHPEYVCNHCSVSGAASVVLTHFFGNVGFTDTSYASPGLTRNYRSFADLEGDVKQARLYGGVHFWNSITTGDAVGANIGRYVLTNKLTPQRGQEVFTKKWRGTI